jgi:plastocyanin
MSSIKFITIGLASTLLLAACTTTPQPTTEKTTPTITADDSTIQQDITNPESETITESNELMVASEIAIEMTNFKYSRDTITAKPGDTVTVLLTSSEGMHNLYIDELEVQSDTLQAGEQTTLTIQIPSDTPSGTQYAYYCAIGNHRANGMEGTLVIQ